MDVRRVTAAAVQATPVFLDRAATASAGRVAARQHRKLMPTGGERLVWAMGDGSTLAVFGHDARPRVPVAAGEGAPDGA